MSEFKGTCLPWVQHDSEYCPEEIWGDLDGPLEDGRIRGEKVCEVNMDHPRAHVNIQLILEAGTVLHETGLRPRELQQKIAELERDAERYRKLKQIAFWRLAGWVGSGDFYEAEKSDWYLHFKHSFTTNGCEEPASVDAAIDKMEATPQ